MKLSCLEKLLLHKTLRDRRLLRDGFLRDQFLCSLHNRLGFLDRTLKLAWNLVISVTNVIIDVVTLE